MILNITPIHLLQVFLVSLWSLQTVLGLSSSISSSRSTVLYGPAARELLLLTAKLAAREGFEAACVCSPGTEDACQRLMYGDESIRSRATTTTMAMTTEEQHCRARPVSTGEEIQAALEAAESILFVGYDQPIDEKSYRTLLNSAGEKLSKVVLLSKMGVSHAATRGGFFGSGSGGDGKLLQSETTLRELCKAKNVHLSIVRAGILKGGGPGEDGNNDVGLAPCYYNTLLDIVEASVTMAHDKYTLGVDCRPGDTISMPNILAQMSSKSSFEACPYDTNRAVVAGAVVAAALYDAPVEVTVSAAKGREPPMREAWTNAFASAVPVA